MLPRYATALLGLLVASQAACSSCEQLGPRARFVKVRWPASAPAGIERRLEESREVPGVQAREGREADLHFLEVVMGEAAFDAPLPLVVLLHGRGDRPRVPGGPFGHVPTPFRLIMPRAPTPLGSGYTWLSVSITQGQPEALARALAKRANHLAVFVERVMAGRAVLGRPIVAGFSQGAMLTYTLAIQRPTALMHAFPLVGWLPPSLLPPEPGPDVATREGRPTIRSVHGTADPIIPIEPARALVKALEARHWPIELHEFDDVAHVMNAEMNATFETWLEAALAAQAPGLEGGLGEPGPEPETYEPFEPLEPETIEAIEAEELQAEEDAARASEEATEAEGESLPDEGPQDEDEPPHEESPEGEDEPRGEPMPPSPQPADED